MKRGWIELPPFGMRRDWSGVKKMLASARPSGHPIACRGVVTWLAGRDDTAEVEFW
jgi:hypothetical protein